MFTKRKQFAVMLLALLVVLAFALQACDLISEITNGTTKEPTTANYKVEHYQQDLSTGYVLADSETLSGTIGEQTAVVAKTYNGFTAQPIDQKTINADGTTTVKVYYNRNVVSYTVKHLLQNDQGGYDVVSADTQTLQGKFGAQTNAIAKSYEGYITPASVEQKTIGADGSTVIEIKYAKVPIVYADYTVKHYQQNIADDDYTLISEDTQTLNGIVGSLTEAEAKEYAGFDEPMFVQQAISEDGSTVINIYYNRTLVTINFADGDQVFATAEVKYGAIPACAETLTKTDGISVYAFDGFEEELVVATEPATYHAKFSRVSADEGLQMVSVNGVAMFGNPSGEGIGYNGEVNAIIALHDISINNSAVMAAKEAGFGYLEVTLSADAWWSATTVLGAEYSSNVSLYTDMEKEITLSIDISAIESAEGSTKFATYGGGDGGIKIFLRSAKFTKAAVSEKTNYVNAGFVYETTKRGKLFADNNGMGGFIWAQNEYSKAQAYLGVNVDRDPADYSTDVGTLGNKTGGSFDLAGYYIRTSVVKQAQALGYTRLEVSVLVSGVDGVYYWAQARDWEAGINTEGTFAHVDENGFTKISIDISNYETDQTWTSLPFIYKADKSVASILYLDAHFAKGEQATAGYTVEHYKQNANGVGYSVVEEDKQELSGIVGAATNAVAKEYAGFEVVPFSQVIIDADGNTVVKIYYNIPTVNYVVRHMLQNANDDGYVLAEDGEQTLSGLVGLLTVAEAKTLEGYTAQSFEQVAISADGNTVVEIKYNRNVVNYSVKHYKQKTDGSDYELVAEDSQTLSGKFGSTTNAQAKEYTDYTVVTFAQQIIALDGSTEIAIYYNYAKLSKATTYTVKHFKQNLENEEFALVDADTQTINGMSNTETEAVAKEYEGFTAQSFSQKTIENDGVTVVEIYYTRNSYAIKFVDGERVIAQQSVKYGAMPVFSGSTAKYDGLVDYTFTGWDKDIVAVAGDATYTAQYSHGEYCEYGLQLVSENGKALLSDCGGGTFNLENNVLKVMYHVGLQNSAIQAAKALGYNYLEVTLSNEGYWAVADALTDEAYSGFHQVYDPARITYSFVIDFSAVTKTEGVSQFCFKNSSTAPFYVTNARFTKNSVSELVNYASIGYNKDHDGINPYATYFADNNGQGGFKWAQNSFSYAQPFLGTNVDLTEGFSADVGCAGNWTNSGFAGIYIRTKIVKAAQEQGFKKIVVTCAVNGVDCVYYWAQARDWENNIDTQGVCAQVDANGIVTVEIDITKYNSNEPWTSMPFIKAASTSQIMYPDIHFSKENVAFNPNVLSLDNFYAMDDNAYVDGSAICGNGQLGISNALLQEAKESGYNYLEVTLGCTGYWSVADVINNEAYNGFHQVYDNNFVEYSFVIDCSAVTATTGFTQFCSKSGGAQIRLTHAKFLKGPVSELVNYASIGYNKDHNGINPFSSYFADSNGKGGFKWAQNNGDGSFAYAQPFLGTNVALTSDFSGDVGCAGAWTDNGLAGIYMKSSIVTAAKEQGFTKIVVTCAVNGVDGVYYWAQARDWEVNIATQGTFAQAEGGLVTVEIDLSNYSGYDWVTTLPFISATSTSQIAYVDIHFEK